MIRTVACLAATVLGVLTAHAEETGRKTLQPGSNPESVCRGFEGKVYATMINGDEPGDGTIVVIDDDKVDVFAKGMNAPKGLAFVGGYLVTADETTMWKVDKSGNASKLAEAKDFPRTIEFLNDVAASRDGESVYVSEMSTPTPMFDPSGERKLWELDSPQAAELPRKGCVYRVSLSGEVSEKIPDGSELLRFPNGLAVGGTKEKERLFVGDFFTGNIVVHEDGQYRKVAQGPRGLDGLAVSRTAFIASSWPQGVVWRIDRKTKETQVLADDFQTAADFFFDRENKQLIVPDMLAGTLTFLPYE